LRPILFKAESFKDGKLLGILTLGAELSKCRQLETEFNRDDYFSIPV